MAYSNNPCDNRLQTLHTYGLGAVAYASQLVTPSTCSTFQLAAILSRLPIGALDSQIQANCNIQTCSELYLRDQSNATRVRPNEVVPVILLLGGLAIASKPGKLGSQSPVVYIAIEDRISHFMYFSRTNMHQ